MRCLIGIQYVCKIRSIRLTELIDSVIAFRLGLKIDIHQIYRGDSCKTEMIELKG